MIPEKCHHGIPLRRDRVTDLVPRCIDCEIFWEQEGLNRARADVDRYRQRVKKLLKEKGRPNVS